jgi:hypothetical protein
LLEMAATDDDPITSWLRKRARIGDGECGGR